MRIQILILISVISFFNLSPSAGSDSLNSSQGGGLGFRFLHSDTPEGFLEYDFQPDGTLFFYWFSESASSSGPDVKSDYFEPVFGVEKQKWILVGSELTIFRGGKKITFELKQTDQKASWGEFSASKVDKLKFLESVEKYTTYKDGGHRQDGSENK